MKNWNKPLDEHEFDDDFLKELFARESPAEEKSKEKMEEIYDEIRKNGKSMRLSASRHRVTINKRLLTLLAAALFLLMFSISTFASSIPYADFFSSLFGSEGIGTTEEHPYVYDPKLILPKQERVPADTAMAEKIMGQYVNVLQKTETVHHCEFELENCLIDECGNGYLTYWLRCESGFDWIKDAGYHIVCFAEDGDVCEPLLKCEKLYPFTSYTIIDPVKSNEEKIYLIMVFQPVSKFESDKKIYIEYPWYEDVEADEPIYYTKTVPLPITKFLPAKSFSSSNHLSAKVSALGLELTDKNQKRNSDSIVKKELRIIYQNGTQYIVKSTSKNLENFWSAAGYANKEYYVFNRMVFVDEIQEIQVDGIHLFPDKQ